MCIWGLSEPGPRLCVSADSNIQPDDVVKAKSALAQTGHYQVPDFGITPIPDTNMIDGIKKFQKENGLKVDGVMKPNGPTENTLAPQVKPIKVAPIQEQKPQTPQPPKLDPLTGLPELKVPQPKKPKTALIPEGKTVQNRIQSMMQDKRYRDASDTRLRDHVVKQFEKAFPGDVEYDETGKMVQPQAVIQPDEVEPFDPDGELKSFKHLGQGEHASSTSSEAKDDQGAVRKSDNQGLRPDEKSDGSSPSPAEAIQDACYLYKKRKELKKKYEDKDKFFEEYGKIQDGILRKYGGYQNLSRLVIESGGSIPGSCS